MSEPKRKYVKVTKQDGIAWTLLNRPEKKNAMSPALHREMADTLDELQADPDAKEAVRIGIGNKAVPRDQLEAETTKLAQKLMTKSPAALRATKQAIRQVRQMDFNQAAEYLQEKKGAMKVGDADQSYSSGLHQ